jgi:plastocyanin
MKSNRILILTLALVVPAMVACGGGEEPAASTGAAAAAAPAPAPAASGPTGSIAGSVAYANGDPDAEISMDADPVCVSLHSEPVHTEKVVGNEGQLANVFVYVKEGISGSYSAPAESALLDQIGCQYVPHVSGVQVGQPVVIRNSDQTLHNVHAIPEINAEFNNGQPFQGMELEHTFDKAEIMVPLKCDVHPWMSTYIGVVEHPFFAVTGMDGSFSIDGLPPGDYVLEAWHEELGTQTVSVSVSADGAADASFDFTPTAS